MTAIIRIYILSPVKNNDYKSRPVVAAVNNYTANGQWGVCLGEKACDPPAAKQGGGGLGDDSEKWASFSHSGEQTERAS